MKEQGQLLLGRPAVQTSRRAGTHDDVAIRPRNVAGSRTLQSGIADESRIFKERVALKILVQRAKMGEEIFTSERSE